MLPAIPATVTEVKERLDGTSLEFRCEHVAAAPGKAVILYRMPSGLTRPVHLPPSSLSFGYYWVDRPYNVYHWLRPDGSSAGCYINIADRTRINHDRVHWRDLVVDILAIPGEPPQILDRDELPADLDPSLRAYIDTAVSTLLSTLPTLLEEVNAESAEYLAALGPADRAIGRIEGEIAFDASPQRPISRAQPARASAPPRLEAAPADILGD